MAEGNNFSFIVVAPIGCDASADIAMDFCCEAGGVLFTIFFGIFFYVLIRYEY